MSLSPSTSRYFMLTHYNADENNEYVSSSFETHDSVLEGSVRTINVWIQIVFLWGAGGGGGRQMALHYVGLSLNPLTWKIWWAPNNDSRWKMGFNSALKGLMSFLLDIFDGRVAGIMIAGNWKVKTWAYQTPQKSYQGFWKFPKWLKKY
jgi:hypothetical protein